MYLADTNIFLEILLAQGKSEICKKFLQENLGKISMSDFSLHSIGVILFRNNKRKIFETFINDIIADTAIKSLEESSYLNLPELAEQYKLDFDDVYQFEIAVTNNLTIVTMDNDFKKCELKLDSSSDCDWLPSGLIFSQQHRPSCTDITNQTGFKKLVERNAP